MGQLARHDPPDPITLAKDVLVKAHDKHDEYLDEDLLNQAYATRSLDVDGAWSALGAMAAMQAAPPRADAAALRPPSPEPGPRRR
jgi:hypothetical protein